MEFDGKESIKNVSSESYRISCKILLVIKLLT